VQVSNFTSKFDAFLKGNYTMTADEMAGYQLFKGKGNCNSCHVDGRGTTLQPGQTDTSTTATANPPLFTCFGSANEGLPLNPRDAFYYQTTPDAFGFIPNPYGFGYRDLGMGTFLRSGFGSGPNPNRNWTQFAPSVDGQFQVSTVRNVAMTPPQCPTTEAGTGKPYFQKEFFHNGYIKSLKQLVHFYNTRDTSFAQPVTSGHCPPGTIERVTCWPMKEVTNNLDKTTGMLGLTDKEEDQIVAFLETLTDGFTAPYPNSDTFTGSCMTCNPATDPNCSAVEAGEWRTYPDSTSSALRIGDLRSGAGPEPADSIGLDAKRRKLETNDICSLARPCHKTSDASGRAGARNRGWRLPSFLTSQTIPS
jgi:cytochrome c peroxidase